MSSSPYIPWLSHEDDEFFVDGSDSWVSYLRRNISHGVGEELPFPDSSWDYDSYDEAIREEVLKALYDNQELDGSHIVVLVLNGVICLLGKVSSEYEGQVAGKIAEQIPDAWGVRNELEVEIN